MGTDLWSDVEDGHFPAVRTLQEVDVPPGGSSPLLHGRDLLEVTLVLDGRLAIVDDVGSGEARGKGAVHVASYGTGLALRRFNESMNAPVRLLRICLEHGASEKRPSSVWGSLETASYDGDAFEPVMLPIANADDSNSPRPEAQITIHGGRIPLNRSLVHAFPENSNGYLLLVGGSAQVATESAEATVDAGGAVVFIHEDEFTIRTRSHKAQALLFTLGAPRT
jgi:redox-sensitive bicupin YhaK (pirin superfamily)